MKTIRLLLTLWIVISYASQTMAQDPDFHIYLCFGQSNMEGQGTIEAQDMNVDSRFRILQSVNCTGQPAATWRTANPPLSRCNTKIGPADNFGRVMVANLPSTIKVGLVHVAVAGSKIELFDKVNYASYAAGEQQWMKNIIAEYGGNPYAKLVELAKIAQKDGVIKGILMHQGESNTGDNQWANKVKAVYENLLNDLNLQASDVPLLAGQVVDAAQGGICASHNTAVNALPNTIPTAHVISSSGCVDQSDNLHFTSAGYRLLGERYAQKMLSLLDLNTDIPPTITADLSNVTVIENQDLKLTISASGPDLSYKWYRNNQEISGANSKDLAIKAIDNSYDGDVIKVVISNEFGSVESNSIVVTVTDFDGVKILKTNNMITIDGQSESAWDIASAYSLNNKMLTVDNANDLSADVKVLYDEQKLYFLYNVTDNTKRASSNNFWENDAIEIYLDGNNDKNSTYDANDFQFIVRYDASQILEGHDKSVSGIQAAATSTSTGYIIEGSVPWSLLSVSPVAGKVLGIDFHVNDSDLSLRDGKVAWYATEDNSYSNPSTFGSARLEDNVVTSVFDRQGDLISIFPNPFTNTFTVEQSGVFQVIFSNLNGDEIFKEYCEGSCSIGSELPAGIYMAKVISETKVNVVKVIKK